MRSMRRIIRACLVCGAVLGSGLSLSAQNVEDRPTRLVPLKTCSRQELNRLQALERYADGLTHEKHNRLLEAVHCFEEALTLDPDGAPIYRSIIPLYLALDRVEDALDACRKVLEIDPGDCATGFLYARQLRMLDRPLEAMSVLRKTAACPGLQERLDLRAQVFFDLGVLTENARLWPEAEKCFRTAVETLENPALLEQGPFNRDEVNTQAADTYERLGHVCLGAGRVEQALAAFRQAQKKDPFRGPRLSYHLAEVHVQQGRPREALASLQEYLHSLPHGTEGYELKIKLQRQLGRAGAVLPDLEAASGRDPNNNALKLLLAREYRQARRFGDAERIYDRLISEEASAEVYRGLFDLFKEDQERGADNAFSRLDRAIRLAVGPKKGEPNEASLRAAANVRAMLIVLRDDAALIERLLKVARKRLVEGRAPGFQTRALLGSLAARQGALAVAEEMFRSCMENPRLSGDTEAEVYRGLLGVLDRARKYRDMVAVCHRGLRRAEQTNRVLFHLELARAESMLDHMREALAAAEAAIKESGADERPQAIRMHASLLSQTGRFQEAVDECQALLKEYNQEAGVVRDMRYALSMIYSTAQDQTHSEEQLRLILDSDPNDAMACNALGYLWAEQNRNLDEAEKLIRKALDLDRKQRSSGRAVGADSDRDNAAYLDSLGWVLFRRGRLDDARGALEKAVELPEGEDDPVVWDHLGDVYARLSLPDRAAKVWKKALELCAAGKRRPDDRSKQIQTKLRLVESREGTPAAP